MKRLFLNAISTCRVTVFGKMLHSIKELNFLWVLLNIFVVCIGYEIRVAISPANVSLLESPHWSAPEKVLYFIDFFGQKVFRYDPKTNEIASRYINYGVVSFVIPVKGCPDILTVGVRNSVFLMKLNSTEVGDNALKQISAVDIGDPKNNNINDGKADAAGNLWFGTYGEVYAIEPVFIENRDQGSLYRINRYNYKHPEVKIRPVTASNGITWSPSHKTLFYIDSLTRKVFCYDFVLKTGQIANRTTVFDFDENDIPGLPDGMTIDVDGNLWVATFNGAEVLKINPRTRKLVYRIKIDADYVSSVTWGGDDLSTLYVTTGGIDETNPKPVSGSLVAINNLGTKGLPGNPFVFPNANKLF